MPGLKNQCNASHGSDAYEPYAWVQLVRPLTARTRFVTLPLTLVQELTTGTVRLRGEATMTTREDGEWSDGTPIARDDNRSEDDVEEIGVCAAIDAAISELRGAVCPKAARVCPYDACWATLTRSTRCESATEVLTLLQASERLTLALNGGECVLALRQWADLDVRQEYRAFVRDSVMVALCPRRSGRAIDSGTMDEVADAAGAWICGRVIDRVAVALGPRFALDFYVDREGTHWIVDFSPWRELTDPLLFSWEELDTAPWMANGRAQFRCLDEGSAIRPADEMYHGIPVELRNADAGAALAEAARQLHEREQHE